MTERAILDLEARRSNGPLAIPAEGDDGLFTEAWYPIIPSAELAPGQIVAKPFLDGKVIAVR